jgi:predicted enzyme related to lactoylglutathione lyase
MGDAPGEAVGSIGWIDLTVANADAVRDFYQDVTGWTVSPVDMGGYSDYCMNEPASGVSVAGACHARGSNANLPPQWLIYIVVADLEKSMQGCVELGGTVLSPPRRYAGQGRFGVVRDPGGAAAALFESAR